MLFKHHVFYKKIATHSTDGALMVLKSSPLGLTEQDAKARLEEVGVNEIQHERYSWYQHLKPIILNPFILLLSMLAVVSYFAQDKKGAVVMSAMALISLLLTFIQEFRSSRAALRLKAMVITSCSLHRQQEVIDPASEKSTFQAVTIELPMAFLVPGDLISISAGDMIPADIRLISSKDLFVSQSQLTGESIPIEKHARLENPMNGPGFLEYENLCFMGSNVVSGTATAVVIKTGGDTYLGSIASRLARVRVQTSFDQGIRRFTWLMLWFMVIMVPAVFLINGLTKGNWYDAFMFAVAVAVGLTPEMLPMIVTVNLAKGAMSMAKKKVIVKRLNSIQNFGAIDILCMDKTGTLTQDKVILEKYIGPEGNENIDVLRYAYLNSFYQTGLKNLLDLAILRHVDLKGELGIGTNYDKIDEIPFDFNRKRMSVVVKQHAENQEQHVMICKGAIEEIFKICLHAEIGHKILLLDDVKASHSFRIAQSLNDDGFRVIAVAYKNYPATRSEYSTIDEKDMTLLGFVAFMDPPKETASEAIKALFGYGITVKVLTGDNGRVARKVCSDVGISVEIILHGNQIEQMTDAELDEKVEKVQVFAQLTPAHKERIVHALHRRHHVVGFLGDGINDAPALRAADVGISVDNAVDVAKESADIILLEKNLLVLEQGVLEGRKVFGNIIKYIKMGASSNFGNVFSVLGASAFLPFLPMRPVQLLTQNLLYDVSQTAIPFDNVDKEYLEKPRRWEIGNIGLFMLFMGPISSIFDYATFALLWFFFKANSEAQASLFQSGWFIEGLLSQTLVVHIIRTRRIPFFQSRASSPLLLMTGLIMSLGIFLPFTSVGAHIGLQPLPWLYFPWLFVILISYCLLAHAVKTWFFRRFGNI